MFKAHKLTIIMPKRGYLVAGLLLRLFLAPLLSHPFDMRIFMAVGAAVSRGITPYGQYVLQDIFAATPHVHLYGTFSGIGYPPLWGLVCAGMYLLSSALAPNNIYAYILALKIPIILGELGLAIVVYNILKTQSHGRPQTVERIATGAFLLFIFCPFIMAVGTIWGMFDAIALLFTLLSANRLQDNWKMSSVFLSLSSVLKLYPLVLAPLYSILLYKSKRNLRMAVTFLLFTCALTALLTLLPMFVFNWPISNMYNALTYHVTTTNPSYHSQTSFPYGAASPFNIFALLSNVVGADIEPPWVSIYLWIPACIIICLLLLRARMTIAIKEFGVSTDFALTIQWSLLLLLTLFTTRVWVSEQNLVFLFAFFTLSVFLQFPEELFRVELLWLLLFIFVLVHVPVISFFWLPLPSTLNAATSFANGPLAWVRLLLMTVLTFGWLVLCWHYAIKKLQWWR